MKIRILSVGPVYEVPKEVAARLSSERYKNKKDSETELIRRMVKGGTTLISSRSDRAIAGYHVIKEVLRARDEENFDAVFVNCFGDPGVPELREFLDIPVLGPHQACVHVASLLGRWYSIVTVGLYGAELMRDLSAYYGFSEKLASVRYLEMSPLELAKSLREQKKSVVEKFVKIAKRCIEEDGADVILPGCGYLSEATDIIRESLNVVVLDPIEVPIRMLESLVKMGVKHSKKVFPTPTEEQIKQYKL